MRQVALASFVILCLAGSVDAAPFLYATRPGNGDVVAIDLASGAIVATFPGGGMPAGAVLSADGTRLYVADAAGGELRVFDTNLAMQTVALDPGAAGVALCPGGLRLGVALSQTDALAVIDTTTLTVVATVPVGDQPMAVACADGFFAVANYGAATVTVIDATTLAVVGSPAVGTFPAGVVISGVRAWVTSLFDSNVTVVALPTATVINTVPVASGPRGIAAFAGRIFVASINADTLTVLDAVSAAVLSVIPLPTSGPTDVLAASLTGRIYVGHLGEAAITVVDPVSLAIEPTVTAPVGLMVLAGVSQVLGLSTTTIPTLHPLMLAFLAIVLAFVALRVRGGLALLLVAGLAAMTPGIALAQSVTFSDTTFANADWQIFSESFGTGGHQANQTAGAGNPQPSREMYHFNDALQTVRVLHRWVTVSHNPATNGAISIIDVSWQRNEGVGDCQSQPVMESFVVYQSGVAYVGPEATFTGTAWSNGGSTGLTAGDFDDGLGNSPDFSATGPAISFGYARRTTNATGTNFTSCHRIDNLTIGLTTEVVAGESFVVFTQLNHFSLVGGNAVIGVTRTGDLTNAAQVNVLLDSPVPAIHTITWPAGVGGEMTTTFTATEVDGDFEELGALNLTLFEPSAGTSTVLGRSRALLYRGTSPLAGLWTAIVLALARWDLAGLAMLGVAALYTALRRRRANSQPVTPPASAP